MTAATVEMTPADLDVVIARSPRFGQHVTDPVFARCGLADAPNLDYDQAKSGTDHFQRHHGLCLVHEFTDPLRRGPVTLSDGTRIEDGYALVVAAPLTDVDLYNAGLVKVDADGMLPYAVASVVGEWAAWTDTVYHTALEAVSQHLLLLLRKMQGKWSTPEKQTRMEHLRKGWVGISFESGWWSEVRMDGEPADIIQVLNRINDPDMVRLKIAVTPEQYQRCVAGADSHRGHHRPEPVSLPGLVLPEGWCLSSCWASRDPGHVVEFAMNRPLPAVEIVS